MTFLELDQRIRQVLPDSPDRRHILQGLHEIEEGHNQCLSFFLLATNHRYNDGAWRKQQTTPFQVQ